MCEYVCTGEEEGKVDERSRVVLVWARGEARSQWQGLIGETDGEEENLGRWEWWSGMGSREVL